MNLQIILYYLSFLSIYFPFSKSTRNKDLVAIKSGLAEISPCSVGMQFYTVLNNSADEDYFVELISDECCINSDENTDCDSIEIIGESSDIIQKGNSKMFTLVAPVIDPYKRSGYCVIHVDSRPIDKRNSIMKDTITIGFDTTIKDIGVQYPDIIKKCINIDEDPFNDCKPVNCEVYYNGKKPIFDESTKKCIKVPKCRSKKSEISNYDPITKKCSDVHLIENEDIDFIKSLSKERQPKDVIIVESPDDIMHNFHIDGKNSMSNGIKQKIKADIKRKFLCNSLSKYLMTNKYTLVVIGIILLVQCFLICSMIYCLTKRSICCDKTTVDRKYFNYRQDVSVTTPLIATSNIDTETAIDYVSESSNNEKKIKCYKSCQKERKSDAKISMSDDILTKCLNRRDWNAKPKSETKETNASYFNSFNAEWKALQTNVEQTKITEDTRNENEEKGTETEEKKGQNRKRIIDFKEDYGCSDSSEKFIKCHDYNFTQSINNIGKDNPEKKVPSMSTEKGAQACFSNDSIDDFLSERGMIFLAGDRLSKYSFTSTSTNQTDGSSKTSKNRNIVKNVLSYLSKKSKKYTLSDPGGKKGSAKNLELIHMSKASMYSSSASEYRNTNGVKSAKDSRSTF